MLLLLVLAFTPLNSGDSPSVTVPAVIATIVSSVIGGVVAYLTKRSGDKATVTVAETTTRGQVEEEAFKRAEAYYLKANEDRDARLREAAEEITTLKARVAFLEERVEHAEAAAEQAEHEAQRIQRTARRLAKGLYELRHGGIQVAPDPVLDEAVVELLSTDNDD